MLPDWVCCANLMRRRRGRTASRSLCAALAVAVAVARGRWWPWPPSAWSRVAIEVGGCGWLRCGGQRRREALEQKRPKKSLCQRLVAHRAGLFAVIGPRTQSPRRVVRSLAPWFTLALAPLSSAASTAQTLPFSGDSSYLRGLFSQTPLYRAWCLGYLT